MNNKTSLHTLFRAKRHGKSVVISSRTADALQVRALTKTLEKNRRLGPFKIISTPDGSVSLKFRTSSLERASATLSALTPDDLIKVLADIEKVEAYSKEIATRNDYLDTTPFLPVGDASSKPPAVVCTYCRYASVSQLNRRETGEQQLS